jgi:hypothetical protein
VLELLRWDGRNTLTAKARARRANLPKPGCNDRHADVFAHQVVHNRAEDEVGIRIGGLADNLCRLVDLKQVISGRR